MLKEFKQFLLRGNVVDLAVGVVVGAAFSAIITALVADIITLYQRAGKQVNVPTNFGVSKNVVIKGGGHVEGELSVEHLTGPVEWQVTERSSSTSSGIELPHAGCPASTLCEWKIRH